MNRRRWILGTLAGAFVCTQDRVGWANDSRVAWQTNYAQAQHKRIVAHQPLLVFVTMNGCHFCHKMLAETYSDPSVANVIQGQFVPTKIDGSRQRQLADQFGVRIFPTTFLISPDNLVIDRIEGYMPPDVFRQRVATASAAIRR